MVSQDTQKFVNVVCPVCSKSKKLPIPADSITRPDGLTTISIPSNIICEHTFQIYIDQNYVVRGFLKSDFEIGTVNDSVSNKNNLSFNLLDFNTRFGDDGFSLLIEALTIHAFIILVGGKKEEPDKIKANFVKLIPDSEKSIEVSDQIEYNLVWKNRIFSSEYQNSFVFNWDMGIVIKTPEKSKKSKFGLNVIADIKKIHGNDAQNIILKNWIKKVDLLAETVDQFMKKDPKMKSKDVIKNLEKIRDYNEKVIPFETIIQKLILSHGDSYKNLL